MYSWCVYLLWGVRCFFRGADVRISQLVRRQGWDRCVWCWTSCGCTRTSHLSRTFFSTPPDRVTRAFFWRLEAISIEYGQAHLAGERAKAVSGRIGPFLDHFGTILRYFNHKMDHMDPYGPGIGGKVRGRRCRMSRHWGSGALQEGLPKSTVKETAQGEVPWPNDSPKLLGI